MRRTLPLFSDLRAFLAHLDRCGQLARVRDPVSVEHDVTEIHRRVLRENGPALLFERPIKADGAVSDTPLLVNLFGTVERAAWGLGVTVQELPALGEALAELRAPQPPQNLGDAARMLPLAWSALATRPRTIAAPPAQQVVLTGDDVDLAQLPIQIPWPGEPAPLITWPLVITRAPSTDAAEGTNAGVYRLQVLGRDRAVIRWLAHRGGARHHRAWRALGRDMPVAVAIGADPATMLSAALPLPETVPELLVAGVLRAERPRLAQCVSVPMLAPADAEIVLEGLVSAHETALEGPYGDHTGYYNAAAPFPLMRVTAITMRRAPIYVSTFTGRAPDEPSRIGEAFNALFLPLARRQFPELVDLWLPPEACSYRMAIASIDKRYPGHARRLMLGLWSLLPQLSYTKLIVVVDADINPRDWADVVWAITTRSDPSRDLVTLNDTPIDDLDFASPKPGLGGKLGIDATAKIGAETEREWGRPIAMDRAVVERIDALWPALGLCARAPVRGAA